MRDKHEVLNKIVIDYMTKSHMFHRKANQKFQTLSSIDTEGHKLAEALNQKQGHDKELHRMKVLADVNVSTNMMSPGD